MTGFQCIRDRENSLVGEREESEGSVREKGDAVYYSSGSEV